MVVEVPLPDAATLNRGFKLLTLIAAPRAERHDRRIVIGDVGSGTSAVSGRIEAA